MLPQTSNVGIYLPTVWAREVARHSSRVLLLMLLSNVLLQTGGGAVMFVTLIARQHFCWTRWFPVFQSEVLGKEGVNYMYKLSNTRMVIQNKTALLVGFSKTSPASCLRPTCKSFHIGNRWRVENLKNCCCQTSPSGCWLSHFCDAGNKQIRRKEKTFKKWPITAIHP